MKIPRYHLLLAAAFLFAYFCVLSLERLIGRDEGFYLMAAKLITEGKLPYIDFFYPQMPLLPYVYALWMKLVGMTWNSARLFTALLASLQGLLLFWLCVRKFNLKTAYLATFVFATCNFVFPWQVTAQSYALSSLLLLGSVAVLDDPQSRTWRHAPIIAGILFGLSVSTRLFFAGLLPLFILYIFVRDRRQCLHFFCGTVIGTLPAVIFLLLSADLFFFNNLGYHFARSSKDLEESLPHKLKVAGVILGFRDSIKFDAFQIPLLAYLTAVSVFLLKRRKEVLPCACYIAIGLFVLNLIPTPTYVQYFCTLVPFLILTICQGFSPLFSSEKRKRLFELALVGLVVLFYHNNLSDFERYTRTGEGVIGIRKPEKAQAWNLPNIEAISTKISAYTEPGDTVLTIWPGYLLETDTKPLTGNENHFGVQAGDRLSPEERNRYRVTHTKGLVEAVQQNTPDLILYNTQSPRRRLRRTILASNYQLVGTINPIEFYQKSYDG